MLPRIAITPGEPSGIGPELIAQIAAQHFPADITVIADQKLLQARASALGLALPTHFKILDTPLSVQSVCGTLNTENVAYVLKTLNSATNKCLLKEFDALVTGPIHKGIINESGFRFSGHTE